MLASLRARLYAIGALALSAIAFFLRFKMVKHQRDKARVAQRRAEAQVKENEANRKSDAEIYAEYSDIERLADEDLKSGKMPENIKDRNRY